MGRGINGTTFCRDMFEQPLQVYRFYRMVAIDNNLGEWAIASMADTSPFLDYYTWDMTSFVPLTEFEYGVKE